MRGSMSLKNQVNQSSVSLGNDERAYEETRLMTFTKATRLEDSRSNYVA